MSVPSGRFTVTDLRSGLCLGDRVEKADRFLPRLKGLLGRAGLAEGEGLLLEDCASVHTCFMRFSIDLCFLGAGDEVVRVVEALGPWRAASAVGARRVLELPAGAVRRADLRQGDVQEVSACV